MALYDDKGAIVEGAMLPDEVTARVTEAVTAKETEFSGVKTELEGKIAEKDKALGARANEFAQFRKLTDEAYAKLDDVSKQLYENQLAQNTEREKRAEDEKVAHAATVDSFLKTKAGTDEKLFSKMKEMWAIVGIEANNPEQMEQKAKMILGAIGTTEPDLLASIGGLNGGVFAPGQSGGDRTVERKESFADTEKGKAGAAELGLPIEVKK